MNRFVSLTSLFLTAPLLSAAARPRAAVVPQAEATSEQLAAARSSISTSHALTEVTLQADGVTPALTRARGALRRFSLDEAGKELEQARTAVSKLPCGSGAARSARVEIALLEAELALASGNTDALSRAAHDALASRPDLALDSASYPPPLLEALTQAKNERAARPVLELLVETVPENAALWVDGASQPAFVGAERRIEVSATPHWLCASLTGWRPGHVRFEPEQGASSLRILLEEESERERAARLADALRNASAPDRPAAAKSLASALSVEAVVLAGPEGVQRFDWQSEPAAQVTRETVSRPFWKRSWFWMGAAAAGLAAGGALIYLESRSSARGPTPGGKDPGPTGPRTSVVCCQ